MPIAINLRRSASKNAFRDAITYIVGSGHADEILLCSGFFQERRYGYFATSENGFAASCARTGLKLITVGVHNDDWLDSYREFKKSLLNAGVNAHCKYKAGLQWHAKVFIALLNGEPQFGIIGSSNITRPAFSTSIPFNRECDVMIWPDGSPCESLINEALGQGRFEEVIRAPYLPDLNGGISVSDRLRNLYDEILSDGLLDL